MKADRAFLLAHPAHFLALGCGAGLMPKAPGTVGTLVALPLYLTSYGIGGPLAVLLAAALVFALGVWAAGVTGKALGVSDFGGIVIDEIAAFLLVLAVTPRSLAWIAVAFALFRVFDIWKPWPIGWVDRHIKGGFGVMLDDVLAALYAIGILYLVRFIDERITV